MTPWKPLPMVVPAHGHGFWDSHPHQCRAGTGLLAHTSATGIMRLRPQPPLQPGQAWLLLAGCSARALQPVALAPPPAPEQHKQRRRTLHVHKLPGRKVGGAQLGAHGHQRVRRDPELGQLALDVHACRCKVVAVPAARGMTSRRGRAPWKTRLSGCLYWDCLAMCGPQQAQAGAHEARRPLGRREPMPSCRAAKPSFSGTLTCVTCRRTAISGGSTQPGAAAQP